MSIKILIAGFTHECNTFASVPCTYEQFTSSGIRRGDECISVLRGTPSYIGGMVQYADEHPDVELIPTVAAGSAAPRLTKDCMDRMMTPILQGIKAHLSELDGLCLSLHGAGCGEGEDDLEGWVLRQVRALVGPEMPVTVPLDLHSDISNDMVHLANGLFGIKKYPHTDMHIAGYKALETLVNMIRTGKKPETAVRHLPMLVPPPVAFTEFEPLVSMNAHIRAYCEKNGLIDATFFHGFPYADVACGTASVVVVAEKDAQKHADELARYCWNFRADFVPEILSPEEALNRAQKVDKPGYIVINELSDNPGGGTPGDGTHLLREMLRQNLPGTIFGYMYDPIAAAFCAKHKIGDCVSFMLGGRSEKLHGEPLYVENATICNISNGEAVYVSPMKRDIPFSLGISVRVRVGNVDIVICSVRTQTVDDRPFLMTGADVAQYRYVGLKSTTHFRGFFQSRAAAIIPADPPGLHSANFAIYTYEKTPRPLFPVDPDVKFEI